MELRNGNERGRSMIEMLGVLAIVGILSVGGIAGYSKAMLKHKLVKQTEQISELFNTIDLHLKKFERKYPSTLDVISVFQAMNAIPSGMSVKDSALYDGFGNLIRIRMNDCRDPKVCEGIALSYSIKNGNDFAICNNLMQIAIAHAPTLHRYHTSFTTEDGPNVSYGSTYFGDRFCKNKTCISNLGMQDIVRLCQICLGKKTCTFVFVWNEFYPT